MENQKLDEIASKAQEAFWNVVAKELPQIKTGDFFPEQQLKFDQACFNAVKDWYKNNSR